MERQIFTFNLPDIGEGVVEGEVIEWLKKVGDKVKPGDLLAEVETDKATMELESYNEGTLLYLGVEKGKAVQVDGVLAVVGKDGEDYKAALGNSDSGGGTSGGLVSNEKPAEVAAASSAPTTVAAAVTLPAGAKEIRRGGRVLHQRRVRAGRRPEARRRQAEAGAEDRQRRAAQPEAWRYRRAGQPEIPGGGVHPRRDAKEAEHPGGGTGPEPAGFGPHHQVRAGPCPAAARPDRRRRRRCRWRRKWGRRR